MASLQDMKTSIKHTLQSRGVLRQIKAQLRAEIFKALSDENAPKPQISNRNLIINELIKEYLEYNKYRNTLSVFMPESGQPTTPPFDRTFLANQLHVPQNVHSTKIPLLYSLVALLKGSAQFAYLGSEEKKHRKKNTGKSNASNVARTRPPDQQPDFLNQPLRYEHYSQMPNASALPLQDDQSVPAPKPILFSN